MKSVVETSTDSSRRKPSPRRARTLPQQSHGVDDLALDAPAQGRSARLGQDVVALAEGAGNEESRWSFRSVTGPSGPESTARRPQRGRPLPPTCRNAPAGRRDGDRRPRRPGTGLGQVVRTPARRCRGVAYTSPLSDTPLAVPEPPLEAVPVDTGSEQGDVLVVVAAARRPARPTGAAPVAAKPSS